MLKAPKNFRKTEPRCCVTCKHYKPNNGDTREPFLECERGGDVVSDVEDYHTICDYYKSANK